MTGALRHLCRVDSLIIDRHRSYARNTVCLKCLAQSQAFATGIVEEGLVDRHLTAGLSRPSRDHFPTVASGVCA